jgi:hypothetical protein
VADTSPLIQTLDPKLRGHEEPAINVAELAKPSSGRV